MKRDEYEDEYDDSVAGELNRRAFRHKRRVRNQIIAIIVTVILVIAIVVGCVIGIGRLANMVNEKNARAAAEEQLMELENSENEQKVIEAPSTMD